MKGLLFCLTLALLALSVFAKRKCTRKTFKANYLKEKRSAFTESICKFRILAAPGLHINLSFANAVDQEQITLTTGEGQVVSIPSDPEHGFVVESSQVTASFTSPAARAAIIFSYVAVFPTDGNFETNVKATNKKKSIKSPGFPRTSLPSDARLVWNVTAKFNEVIVLEILTFSTNPSDSMEVLDGTTVLGRHSGRKKKRDLPITHSAFGGKMTITLQTVTARSKGFKARVYVVESNVTEAVDLTDVTSSSEESERLTCHRRRRVMMGETTLTDDHSRMTCIINEVCGRMLADVTSTDGQSLTSETLNCIPQSICDTDCSSFASAPGLNVKSCQVTCCSTDMCNVSPDGPSEPPQTSVSASGGFHFGGVEEQGLDCYESSHVQIQPDQAGLSSMSSGGKCPDGSVCALYAFSGVSSSNEENLAVGYVATCQPKSMCNEQTCSNMYETEDIDVRSCNVTCCEEDDCNDPDQLTLPVLPTEEPVADWCLNIRRIRLTNGDLTVDRAWPLKCSSGEDRCVRVEAAFVDSQGRNGIVSFGKCIPKSSCDTLSCSEQLDFLDSSSSINTCSAECCSAYMCNERPLQLSAPTTPGTGLWCHQKSALVQEGAVALGDGMQEKLCDDGDICTLFKFYGTSTESHQFGEPMAGYSAACRPASECNQEACNSIPNTDDLTLTSCAVSCCRTNMCNEPGDTPYPSPRPLPPGSVSRCYELQQTISEGRSISERKVSTSCGPGDNRCIRVESNAVVAERPVSIVYGACIPKMTCASMTCSQLTSFVPGLDPSSCRVQCCDSELCNDEPIGELPSPPPSISAVAPTNPLECYELLEMRVMGMVLPGGKKVAKTCPSNFECFKITASASHSLIPGTKVNVVVGDCMPSGACDSACSNFPAMDSIKLEKCESSCCNENLCNA